MLEAYGLTDPGCVRKNNEDFFLIEPDLGLYVVADGMGGAQAGEEASRLAAETVLAIVRGADKAREELLPEAFAEANRLVLAKASSNQSFDGMGTTLSAILENGDRFEIANVGDSRCYRLAEGNLTTVTVDQTWVEEVGRRLGLNEAQLQTHPMRHVLTMAIGAGSSLRVHTYSLPKQPNEHFLLCSDGLHGVLSEEIIADTLRSERSLESKCHYLVEAAKNAGGPDNVTVVLLRTSDAG